MVPSYVCPLEVATLYIVRMYIYIYTYMYMYVRVHTCIHIQTHVCVCIHICGIDSQVDTCMYSALNRRSKPDWKDAQAWKRWSCK